MSSNKNESLTCLVRINLLLIQVNLLLIRINLLLVRNNLMLIRINLSLIRINTVLYVVLHCLLRINLLMMLSSLVIVDPLQVPCPAGWRESGVSTVIGTIEVWGPLIRAIRSGDTRKIRSLGIDRLATKFRRGVVCGRPTWEQVQSFFNNPLLSHADLPQRPPPQSF